MGAGRCTPSSACSVPTASSRRAWSSAGRSSSSTGPVWPPRQHQRPSPPAVRPAPCVQVAPSKQQPEMRCESPYCFAAVSLPARIRWRHLVRPAGGLLRGPCDRYSRDGCRSLRKRGDTAVRRPVARHAVNALHTRAKKRRGAGSLVVAPASQFLPVHQSDHSTVTHTLTRRCSRSLRRTPHGPHAGR